MTHTTTRQPQDDAFARMVGALSTDNPLGSTSIDWNKHPERFPDASSRPWSGPYYRFDAESHELSADAWRIPYQTVHEYLSGLLNAKLLRRSLRSRFAIDRLMARAADLHFFAGTDRKSGPSVPHPHHGMTQGALRRAYLT